VVRRRRSPGVHERVVQRWPVRLLFDVRCHRSARRANAMDRARRQREPVGRQPIVVTVRHAARRERVLLGRARCRRHRGQRSQRACARSRRRFRVLRRLVAEGRRDRVRRQGRHRPDRARWQRKAPAGATSRRAGLGRIRLVARRGPSGLFRGGRDPRRAGRRLRAAEARRRRAIARRAELLPRATANSCTPCRAEGALRELEATSSSSRRRAARSARSPPGPYDDTAPAWWPGG
jgi:hypothetical protein